MKLLKPTSDALRDRFAGALLGGLVGDVIGAAVEAESPGYIRKTFRNLDDILALESVPEFLTGEWQVGRFTDDTQMTICVAEWLLANGDLTGEALLRRFCAAYEPWRHYGSGTRLILESFPTAKGGWQGLANVMFPHGSYGNGSAMRVAPLGLLCHKDSRAIARIGLLSSIVTHSHPLAVQGAVLQATAVAAALRGPLACPYFLELLKSGLASFEERGEDTTVYRNALARIATGISKTVPPAQMSAILGNGIKAQEAVPMAIYCFLANSNSFEKAVESAIFLEGDTDTIGAMTGAIAGAALGESQIPTRWLARIRETNYTPDRIRSLAHELHRIGSNRGFKA